MTSASSGAVIFQLERVVPWNAQSMESRSWNAWVTRSSAAATGLTSAMRGSERPVATMGVLTAACTGYPVRAAGHARRYARREQQNCCAAGCVTFEGQARPGRVPSTQISPRRPFFLVITSRTGVAIPFASALHRALLHRLRYLPERGSDVIRIPLGMGSAQNRSNACARREVLLTSPALARCIDAGADSLLAASMEPLP
jgi:hypothetical protein